MSLEAIKRVCTQEKAKTESSEIASHEGGNGKKQPGTKPTARVPKKARTHKKHCDLCKKHGGVHTMHNTKDCHKYDRDRKEKANFRAAKKGRKKPNPARQNFAQLREKLDKLKKSLKKASIKNPRHTNTRIAIPTLNCWKKRYQLSSKSS
jgi:hypothetical protein